MSESEEYANGSDDMPEADERRRGNLMHVPTPAPVRLFGRARRAAENLPFAGEAFKQWRATEDWALAELKHRLDGIGDSAARLTGRVAGPDPRALLAELLGAARNNSTDEARDLLYMQALEQMAPEQARILAVLGETGPAVLCHVDVGPPVGPTTQRVLANATLAGKDAGIVLRDEVPRLVTHMFALGLVAEGPEAKNRKADYEMLETETAVRRAQVYIKDNMRLWPRIQRRTLRLSDFGAALWTQARPADFQAEDA